MHIYLSINLKHIFSIAILSISFLLPAQNIVHTISKIGNQEVFINSKIEIYFSSLNNTIDIEYSSPDIPGFCSIVQAEKGRGYIIAEPETKDTGTYVITLNANSEIGSAQQKFSLKVKSIPESTQLYYIDPINGSDDNIGDYNNPFKTFSKINASSFNLPGGSIVYLRTGNYGKLVITKLNSSLVYIVAERGNTPGIESLNFNFSGYWYFSGIHISPLNGDGYYNTNYVSIGGGVQNIHISNCKIYGEEDINNWTTNQDWYDYAGNGIYSLGYNCSFNNNYILNTYFSVQISGYNTDVNYNIIENFGGDAIRGLGNNCNFNFNQIKMQLWMIT
ncbi:MAG: hypothetical protein R2771_06395 [Saprospiraceae bacterium]